MDRQTPTTLAVFFGASTSIGLGIGLYASPISGEVFGALVLRTLILAFTVLPIYIWIRNVRSHVVTIVSGSLLLGLAALVSIGTFSEGGQGGIWFIVALPLLFIVSIAAVVYDRRGSRPRL